MSTAHHVTIEELVDANHLQAEWEDLFARSDASVFLSWHWIGSWLRVAPTGAKLFKVKAVRAGQVVGLALLSRQTVRRHGFLSSDLLALHEYAQPGLNFMTEYNGLLVDARWSIEITPGMVRAVVEEWSGWDELQLSGVVASSPVLQPEFLRRMNLGCFWAGTSDARYVDLDRVRAEQKGYLGTLSRKTRYKLRAYCRDWEQLGELRVDEASSREEALAYFDGLKVLHQDYWKGRGRSGSFANPCWEAFHRAVIEGAFGGGGVQLLRVAAGHTTVGYLYSLVHRGGVYMIQSGYNYARSQRSHPGFISVVKAVEHNAQAGNRRFDFLAGDAQYKRMLAHGCERLAWVRLQRPRVKFQLEKWARKIVRRVRRQSDDVAF